MKPAAMDRDLRHGVPRPDTPGLHPDLLTEAVEIAELACLYSNVDKAWGRRLIPVPRARIVRAASQIMDGMPRA